MVGASHPLNAGGNDGNTFEPSFKATADELCKTEPEVIILCPCGFEIERTKEELLSMGKPLEFVAKLGDKIRSGDIRVYVVDGSAMFNRPGPRLVDAVVWLVGVIHQKKEMIPDGFDYETLSKEALCL